MLIAFLLAFVISFAAHAEAVPPEAAPQADSGSSAKKPAGAVIAGVGGAAAGIAYGGSVITGVMYTIFAVPFLAALHDRIPTDPFLLFVPIFGPLQIVHNDNLDHGTRELCYLDAGVQAAGLLMVIGGIALASSSPESHALVPILTPGGAGLAARF